MKKLLPVALGVAGVVLLGQGAIAAPDPTFNPALTEIKQKMPRNLEVRLPSRIGFSDRQNLYPNDVFLAKDSQEFFVILYNRPNCKARACSVGSIVSARDNNQTYAHMLLTRPIFKASDENALIELRKKSPSSWSKSEQELFVRSEGAVIRREPITLKPGLKGMLVTQRGMGASTPPSSSVVWKQGSFAYRVSLRGSVMNQSGRENQQLKTQLINTAISMAKESPIEPG
jgi:hypothetical protein